MAINIIDVKALRGPNLFHHKPVMKMRIDLGDLTDKSSVDLPGFTERLVSLLPDLYEHRCSPGHRGGFIERLHRGTYLGHIIEHVALELSGPVDVKVGFGKTVYGGRKGLYDVIVRYKNEEAMSYLLRKSVRVVEAIINNKPIDLLPIITKARRLKERTELGPSSLAILRAADERQIPWHRLGAGSLVQLGYGVHRKRIQTAVTNLTSLIAKELVQDKDVTKQLLYEAAIPVPRGFAARTFKQVKALLPTLRFPVVVKPVDSHHGLGITMDLDSLEEVLKACELAWKYSSKALIEEQCAGKDYRLLVINGKLVAVSERIPAQVIGDGKSTIEELVEMANKDPRRGKGHGKALTRIELDELCFRYLSSQGLTIKSVPQKDRAVRLVQVANLSKGATAKDVTDEVHDSIRSLAERAALITDLDICGIDLIHHNVAEPVNHSTAVIEVNAGPGLRMHMAPSEGRPREVGRAIIDMLYPSGSGRIPIISITGTNGKTTVARLVAHIAGVKGAVVGLTCSDGILIGGKYVARGDTTGPRSARMVLSDPTVEMAVLETARGGMVRNGLGYDWSDIGVVTNIRPDHFGQDGVESIKDLIRIKSLVPERVKEGGTIILNADDKEAGCLIETAKLKTEGRNIIYYSTQEGHPRLTDHCRKDGRAYCLKNGWICELTGKRENYIARTKDVKITLGGSSAFNVSNVLAATGAARAIGLDYEQIQLGLQTFNPTLHNVGRLNIYKVHEAYVVVDYAHNPDAILAMGEIVNKWKPTRALGYLGLPGDRENALLADSARAAARHFHKLILRDDKDLRGRKPGEVPSLIAEVLTHEFPHVEYEISLDRDATVERMVKSLRPGEVLVAFCDDYYDFMADLRRFDPIPVDDVVINPAPPVTGVAQSFTEHLASG